MIIIFTIVVNKDYSEWNTNTNQRIKAYIHFKTKVKLFAYSNFPVNVVVGGCQHIRNWQQFLQEVTKLPALSLANACMAKTLLRLSYIFVTVAREYYFIIIYLSLGTTELKSTGFHR